MKRLLLALAAACSLLTAAAQQTPTYVYGIDFSLARVSGANESDQQFAEAFRRINQLLITEADKYDFARALRSVAGDSVPASSLLADGLRFSARLAVALEQLSVDDMFTQDELLERLGLGTCEVPVAPDALVAALKQERFSRTNRFMMATPRALGRVRLSVIPDDLLAEHAAAWCASR